MVILFVCVQYVSQCPIAPGSSFTYKFQVNEMPGTYFWHDHSSVNRADGLQGPLIVKPKAGTPEIVDGKIQDTFTLFLHDWWHNPGNALAMRLNRCDARLSVAAVICVGGWVLDIEQLL